MFRKDLRLGLTGNTAQYQEFNLLWTMFFNCKKSLVLIMSVMSCFLLLKR
jgi:hypothetical protein